MSRRAPFTQDQLLDRTGFPGPVTPSVYQDRVRQTYRGGPVAEAPFRSMPEFPAPGLGCSDCRLPPIGMGALPAGAFAGAIGLMLAGVRPKKPAYTTPGTMTPKIAADAGIGKGGGHGGHGGHHHGGGGGRRGRGGGWWGGPVEYHDDVTYVVDANPCPVGYYFDQTALRCMKVPQTVLRGIALSGLGNTGADVCTAIRAGTPIIDLASNACPCTGTDAHGYPNSGKLECTLCKAAFVALNAGIAATCVQVDAASAREAQRAATAAGNAAAAAAAAQAAADAEALHQSLLQQQAAAQAQQKAYAPPTTNYVPWIIGAAVLGGAVWFFRK